MSSFKQSGIPKYYFPASKANHSSNWRTRINQNQLVSQASTIILQRNTKFWASLLNPLKLPDNFTASIFHRILNKIRNHPETCLNFFNWAKKNLEFKPDLTAQCELTRILFGRGLELSKLGDPILNSIIQDYPPGNFVPLLVQSRKGANFLNTSPVLNYVLEFCCSKNMYTQSLEIYQIAKLYGTVFTVSSCNALLELFVKKKELRPALCFYASMIRNGVSGDELTMNVIARILHKDGKFERFSRILDVGKHTPSMFELSIEGYSERGDFEAAFSCLNEMCSKNINTSFNAYSIVLDGACKYQNKKVIETVMCCMRDEGLLSKSPISDYNSIIQKLCGLKKTHAVDFFLKRACDEEIKLLDVTYEYMFRALIEEVGRLKDAIELYDIMQEKNVMLNKSCYSEFMTVLSNENPSEKVSLLLIDIIRRGLCSAVVELSGYVSKLCAEGCWREGNELLHLVMDQGCLLDSSSNGSFVRYYCSCRQIDSAIMLHIKLERMKGSLDVATYNIFLAMLFKEKRIEEAMRVFDYMKTRQIFGSESFSLMIRGLCQEKKMRKAMKLHDEMLELGLKPDRRSYRRLISGFR